MGRMNSENQPSKGLQALVRPGSLDIVGQQTELFPFDAFNFKYDPITPEYRISLKSPWKFDASTIEIGDIIADSLDINTILSAESFTLIDGENPDDAYSGLDYDGGTDLTAEADREFNDNTGRYVDIPLNYISIESPLFMREGVMGPLQSSNYVAGETGWGLQPNGDVEFNDGIFRGNISGSNISGSSIRTGPDPATDARVSLQDESGIIDGPHFLGSGLNDLSIVNEGSVAGTWKVKIIGEITSSTPTYNIGDTGPSGGVVFYIDTSVSPICYYEAWTSDEGSFAYKTTRTAGGASGSSIGSGYDNTYSYLNTVTYPAGYRCSTITHGGYSDWFLPSKDELNQLYIRRNLIGGFNNYYWSSTKFADDYAWPHSFLDWGNNPRFKDESCSVRAIRTFTGPDGFVYTDDNWITQSSEIAIPASLEYAIIGSDITIGFSTQYGHKINDYWSFTQGSMRAFSAKNLAGDEVFSIEAGYIKAHLSELPITDPGVPGALWRNSADIKISL